jgi:hypothetical protein
MRVGGCGVSHDMVWPVLWAVGLEVQAAVYTGVGVGGQGGCLYQRGGGLAQRGYGPATGGRAGRTSGCLESDL